MDLICQKPSFFKNPQKLPLNELFLERTYCKKTKKVEKWTTVDELLKIDLDKYYETKTEKLPAISDVWISKFRSYEKYQPYFPKFPKEHQTIFLERNKLYLEDLRFLLQCTYHQFWNYLIFEPEIEKMLSSFLFNPLKEFEFKYLDKEYLDLYDQIYQHIGTIHQRMFKFQQSEIEYMSPTVALKFLISKKLITMSKIVPLCTLYGSTSSNLIPNIMEFYFSEQQPSQKPAVTELIKFSLQTFDIIGGNVVGFEDRYPVPLSITKSSDFDPYWIHDVACLLLNTATDLHAFFSVCNKTFIDVGLSMGLPHRLTYLYERVYPAFYEMLDNRVEVPFDWSDLEKHIYERLAHGRWVFVNLFHDFTTSILHTISELRGNVVEQDKSVEIYIKLISTSMEDEYFMADYQRTHKIDTQLQAIADVYPELDKTRTDYITECLSMLPSLKDRVKKTKHKTNEFSMVQPVPTTSNQKAKPLSKTKAEISEDQKLKCIQEVLQALPELGDGFVLRCLEVMDYQPTKVISAVLDDKLPPELENVPRNLIEIPDEPEPEQPILAYRGKKPGYKETLHLLDDKLSMIELKDIIIKASQREYDMYDDEYDDRDDDFQHIRTFDDFDNEGVYRHMGNQYENYDVVSDPSDLSSSDDEAKVKTKSKDAFCEDPAALRARREAKFQQHTKTRDVVGKPKGQGQDKNVQQNRDKKNTHKSSKANHNRKSGAQWKRNKGMVPS